MVCSMCSREKCLALRYLSTIEHIHQIHAPSVRQAGHVMCIEGPALAEL